MFDNLTDRLSNSFKAIQGKNKLSEDNIKEAIKRSQKISSWRLMSRLMSLSIFLIGSNKSDWS